jgi:hypothetical protein
MASPSKTINLEDKTGTAVRAEIPAQKKAPLREELATALLKLPSTGAVETGIRDATGYDYVEHLRGGGLDLAGIKLSKLLPAYQ